MEKRKFFVPYIGFLSNPMYGDKFVKFGWQSIEDRSNAELCSS